MSNQIRPDDLQPMESAPEDRKIIVWRQGYGLYAVQYSKGKWVMPSGRVIPAEELTGWMTPET